MAWLNSKQEAPKYTEQELEELEYADLLTTRYNELNSETATRLNRYREYQNFRQGEQWGRIKIKKEDDSEKLTHNLCDPVVRKYSSLLMGDVPKISVPRESEIKPKFDITVLDNPPTQSEFDVEVPVEFDRSEAIEKILRDCLFVKNRFRKALKEAALNGSELGDSMFFVYWDKKKKQPCIERLFPGHVRIAFASSDSDEIEYAFVEKIMSITKIQQKWNFAAAPEQPTADIWDIEQFAGRKVAMVRYCWDEEYYCVRINNQIVPGTKIKHGYSIIPIFHIPNLMDGCSPWGESDLKQVLPVQESYNMALSDEANLSKMYADPKVIVYNPGKTDLKAIGKKGSKVIPASKDSRVEPLAFTGQIFPMQNRISRVKQDFHDISGLSPATFGNAQGSIVTGVAMTAQFQPTLQVIMDKITLWDDGLRRMMAFILELYEKYGGTYPGTKLTYKQIINGWRAVEFQWGSKVPRDDSIYIQNETLKMNQRLQSRSRTMSNLGIDSPQDELQQISLEETNPALNPKLALEKAQVDAQTGSGKETEMIELAQAENEKMAAGQAVPAVGRNKTEHNIHIQVHGDFLKNSPDLPPEAIELVDQHIQAHEQALATGGSQGGARVGAGRPAAEAGASPAPSPAGADQAMAAAMAMGSAGAPAPTEAATGY